MTGRNSGLKRSMSPALIGQSKQSRKINGNSPKTGTITLDIKQALGSARQVFEEQQQKRENQQPVRTTRSTANSPRLHGPLTLNGVRGSNNYPNSASSMALASEAPRSSNSPQSSPPKKKSSSAPASPVKQVNSVTRVTPLAAAAKRVQLDPNTLGPKSSAVSPTGGEGIVGKVTRSNLLLIKADEAPAVANSATPITSLTRKTPEPKADKKTNGSADRTVSENTSSSSNVSGGGKSSSTPQSGKMSLINSEKNSLKRKSEGGGGGGGGGRGNSGLGVDEVIKLRQDEGVMHLLHGLPSSRRKSSIREALTSTNVTAACRRRTSTDGRTSTPPPNQTAKQARLTKEQSSVVPSGCEPENLIPSVNRQKTFRTSQPHQQSGSQKQPVSSLIAPLGQVKPCSQEELMTHNNLELIKSLPTKEYVRLWSSPTRYTIKPEASPAPARGRQSSPAGLSECSSETSSTSAPQQRPQPQKTSSAQNAQPPPPSAEDNKCKVRTKPWNLNTKNLKDLLVRTYPSFAQIIISPVSTGLRHTINTNVIDELIELLGQCATDPECKSVLLTGLGGTFSHGLDLSLLAYDQAPEKQRKSAESLAASVRRLVRYLLDYPKILVAAVNGFAHGLAVCLLPYFDLVFASDKATFSASYVELQQIPEAFANTNIFHNPKVARKLLLRGKTITAEEALDYGLVSEVVWPDKFMETVVPSLEEFEDMPAAGLSIVKRGLMKITKNNITSQVIEDETRELVRNWTSPKYAKNVKKFLKDNHYTFISIRRTNMQNAL